MNDFINDIIFYFMFLIVIAMITYMFISGLKFTLAF